MVQEILITLISQQVEVQFSTKIKVIQTQTDGGGEFKAPTPLHNTKDIAHRLSLVYNRE